MSPSFALATDTLDSVYKQTEDPIKDLKQFSYAPSTVVDLSVPMFQNTDSQESDVPTSVLVLHGDNHHDG